jgi:16S rRNA (cytidine1402-2'-O)-methyltransferase
LNSVIFKNIGDVKSITNGCLILGGMPIGNKKDISLRMLEIIPEIDVVVAENVKFFLEICKNYNLSHTEKILLLQYDGTHTETLDKTLEYLKNNKKVLLISDCGMPTITAAGKEIVRLAVENNITVTSIPGPNVAATALALCGFESDDFHYYGYLPKDTTEKHKILMRSLFSECTLVFLESRTRCLETLSLINNLYDSETKLFIGINMTMDNEILIYGDAQYAYEELSKILEYQGVIWVTICVNNAKYLSSNEGHWTSLY